MSSKVVDVGGMSKYRFKKLKTIWRERWEAEQEGNKENVPPFVINGSLKVYPTSRPLRDTKRRPLAAIQVEPTSPLPLPPSRKEVKSHAPAGVTRAPLPRSMQPHQAPGSPLSHSERKPSKARALFSPESPELALGKKYPPDHAPTAVPAKRRRGRPRKTPLPVEQAATRTKPSASPPPDANRRRLFAETQRSGSERRAKLLAREHLFSAGEQGEATTGGSDWEGVETDEDEEEPSDVEEDHWDDEYAPDTTRAVKERKRPRLPSLSLRGVAGQEMKFDMKRIGIQTEEIIKLINNEETKENIIQKTGFSPNYVMKLQRRVLRASPSKRPHLPFVCRSAPSHSLRASQGLQPRPCHEHSILGKELHVLYGIHDVPMFICKELCYILSVSDTSLAYWKKKVHAEELETSQDFKLMCGLPIVLCFESLTLVALKW